MTSLSCSNEFSSLPTSPHSFSNVMLPHGYALTCTWTDNLTTNNETGVIFLHLLLLYEQKMMTAPYGWGQLQITVLLVTLIINKPCPKQSSHPWLNRKWLSQHSRNNSPTTPQLTHTSWQRHLDICLVIIPSDKQNIKKKVLNTEFYSLAQNCVNVADIFITCYFVTWHFCKHKQTVPTYIHTITHKIFLIWTLKVDNQTK
jgi:hypothetical protein